MKRKDKKRELGILVLMACLCIGPLTGRIEAKADTTALKEQSADRFHADSLSRKEPEQDGGDQDSLNLKGGNQEGLYSKEWNKNALNPESLKSGSTNTETVNPEELGTEGTILSSGKNGDLSWSLDDGKTLRITGSGEFDPKVPWAEEAETVFVQVENIKNLNGMFQNHKNVRYIDFEGSDLSAAKELRQVFVDCENLRSVSFRGVNMEQVSNIEAMFLNCSQLGSVNFLGAKIDKEFTTKRMFKNCESVTEVIYPAHAAGWIALPESIKYKWLDESGKIVTVTKEKAVEDITYTRTYAYEPYEEHKCGDLTWRIDENGILWIKGSGDYVRDCVNGYPGNIMDAYKNLPGWAEDPQAVKEAVVEVDHLTSTACMFAGLTNLQKITWVKCDTSGVTDMYRMFDGCKSLTELDLRCLDTGNAETMSDMFKDCENLQNLDISSFDVKNVASMSGMFQDCKKLTTLDLSHFDTSKLQYAHFMFEGCEALRDLDVSSFDTRKVIWMEYMFSDCKSLENLDLRNFDTINVKSIHSMFAGCVNLKTLDISSFEADNVWEADSMFKDCSLLTGLDLGNFNLSGVRWLDNMFSGCKSLKELQVNHFDVSRTDELDAMFYDCENLTSLDLSKWTFMEGATAKKIIEECKNLTQIKLPAKVTAEILFPETPADESWRGEDGTVYTQAVQGAQTTLTYHRVKNAYRITYVTNGGINSPENPATYQFGKGVSEKQLKAATKEGYTFEGWYEAADFSGNKVTQIARTEKRDITLYAKYEKLPTKEEVFQNQIKLNGKLRVAPVGSRFSLRWGKVSDADGYEIYAVETKGKYPSEPTVETKADVRAVKISKINGKKINVKSSYQFYVRAYKLIGGKKITLGESIPVFSISKKNTEYSTTKHTRVEPKKMTLKPGGTGKISAKTILFSSRKKALTKVPVKEFRFESTDKKVATVDASGKVKAVGAGSCFVFIYARDGNAQKIKVTVK